MNRKRSPVPQALPCLLIATETPLPEPTRPSPEEPGAGLRRVLGRRSPDGAAAPTQLCVLRLWLLTWRQSPTFHLKGVKRNSLQQTLGVPTRWAGCEILGPQTPAEVRPCSFSRGRVGAGSGHFAPGPQDEESAAPAGGHHGGRFTPAGARLAPQRRGCRGQRGGPSPGEQYVKRGEVPFLRPHRQLLFAVLGVAVLTGEWTSH